MSVPTMKDATAIGEKYPKLMPSVEDCSWCETVFEHLYRGETIAEICDTCEECGRCVACCGDDGTCKKHSP